MLDLVGELLADLAVADSTYAAAVRRSGGRVVIDLLRVCGSDTFPASARIVARTQIPANAPTLAPSVCGASRRPLRS